MIQGVIAALPDTNTLTTLEPILVLIQLQVMNERVIHFGGENTITGMYDTGIVEEIGVLGVTMIPVHMKIFIQ